MSEKVFVGLSGGVDSSVADLRLIKAGYDVTGVFIKVWHPDFLVCNWEQERLDAMRVAAKLGIPFLTCDAEAAYRDEVAAYFINEYKAGRTPNPDVMCNKEVKFGAFMQFAKERGADYIATGHYAERVGDQLLRGLDKNKDQSYFLWTLTNEQLANTLLPVGNSTKDTIRKEAAEFDLITAQKKDSQGVCFLGHIDIPEFLSHYIDLKPGEVIDETGKRIGSHQGAFVYTVGQRHGFTLKTENTTTLPHYVIEKNIINNTITVSTTPPKTNPSTLIRLTSIVLRHDLSVGDKVEVQTRYRQAPSLCEVTTMNNEIIELKPQDNMEAIASGQSCVLYQGQLCLGGGIIA